MQAARIRSHPCVCACGTQFGLLLLAELFNEEGWFWGAAYNREDSMHFEVGVETLRKWQAEGKL